MSWKKQCSSEVLEQWNPTCDPAHYLGGAHCCGSGRLLLDADQAAASLAAEQLRYHMKVRIWFQEYQEDAPHINLEKEDMEVEATFGEYDVPPAYALLGQPLAGYPNWPSDRPTPGTTCQGDCPNGPDCECQHELVSRFTSGLGSTCRDLKLITARVHCHAPSCVWAGLYRNESGVLDLLCEQRPLYGNGHGVYEEMDFLTIPPCLWSDDPRDGLPQPPLLLAGSKLVSIKHNRNTHHGHTGEMLLWQLRVVAQPTICFDQELASIDLPEVPSTDLLKETVHDSFASHLDPDLLYSPTADVRVSVASRLCYFSFVLILFCTLQQQFF